MSIYRKSIVKAVEKMVEDQDFIFNIREIFPETSPSEVRDILLELGWEDDGSEDNGWEQDTWYYFVNNSEYDFDLIMNYSGYYWDLRLYRKDCKEY